MSIDVLLWCSNEDPEIPVWLTLAPVSPPQRVGVYPRPSLSDRVSKACITFARMIDWRHTGTGRYDDSRGTMEPNAHNTVFANIHIRLARFPYDLGAAGELLEFGTLNVGESCRWGWFGSLDFSRLEPAISALATSTSSVAKEFSSPNAHAAHSQLSLDC